MSEIVADYRQHRVGEREKVNWTRPSGVYFDVPVVYIREATADEYYEQFPHLRGQLPADTFFWEVVTD